MRRLLAPLAIGAVLLGLAPAAAWADSSPSPSPSPSTSASASPSPTPTQSPTPTPTAAATATPEPSPDPSPSPSPSPTPTPTPTPTATPSPVVINPTPTGSPSPVLPTSPPPGSGTTSGAGGTQQAPPAGPPTSDSATQPLIEQARQQLGSGIADALATAQQLSDALNQNAEEQAQLQQQIDASQGKLDALDAQIQQDSDDMASTQQQITDTRAQIAVLARELYQQPDSLLMRLLSAGSVRGMLTQASDVAVAAMHADSLRQKLNSDLTRLQQDQTDQQSARTQEVQVQDQLNTALAEFTGLSQQLQDGSDQLQSVINDSQAALDGLGTDANLVQQLTAVLLNRQQQMIATAENLVWQQAHLWATLNGSLIQLPSSTTFGDQPSPGTVGGGLGGGYRFAWPIQGAVLTQGFGPSTLSLEPAAFGFAHFHTGLDLASADTRIGAAADGVVAAVGHGNTGYGNYVIILHGGGVETLYGHLSVTMVTLGQKVLQGQQIGVEGSTGNSTGVHLHFEVRINGTPVDPSPYLPPIGSA